MKTHFSTGPMHLVLVLYANSVVFRSFRDIILENMVGYVLTSYVLLPLLSNGLSVKRLYHARLDDWAGPCRSGQRRYRSKNTCQNILVSFVSILRVEQI